MAGAYVLAQQLAITGIHIGSALRAYERAVKPAIEKKQAAGRRLARWFVPDNQAQLMIWDWVTRMVNWPAGRWLLKRLLAPESIIRS